MKHLSIFDLSHGDRWVWVAILYMAGCPIIAILAAAWRWWIAP